MNIFSFCSTLCSTFEKESKIVITKSITDFLNASTVISVEKAIINEIIMKIQNITKLNLNCVTFIS